MDAGYYCLCCMHTFSTLFAVGQHTGSPYMRGTTLWLLDISAKLLNMPSVHLATGLAQEVLILSPTYARRAEIRCYCPLLRVTVCFYLLQTPSENAVSDIPDVLVLPTFCTQVKNTLKYMIIMKNLLLHHYYIVIIHCYQVSKR